MIHTVNAVRTLQAVAVSVGLALLLWSTGLPTLFLEVEAASVSDASDTLSNSAPSQGSNHTIAFTTPNGMSASETFTLEFDGAFVMGTVGEDEVDILINTASATTAPTAGVDTWGVSRLGSIFTFEAPSNSGVASSSDIVVRIGTNAVDFGSGSTTITNPSSTTTSYEIIIGGTMQDSGEVRVAIVDEVTVTASVDTVLSFTVSGVDAGSSVNGSPTTTVATTSSISLPFGTLTSNVSRTLAHDLSITTNAFNGYTVTVEQTGPLQSTTGATIDGFIDGGDTTNPSPWQAPGEQVVDPDSYGHWGLTTEDTLILARAGNDFGSDEWVSGSTTPIAIMGHDGPTDGVEPGEGATRVGYQIEISPLQEAGDDYTTTLRYIATPTF